MALPTLFSTLHKAAAFCSAAILSLGLSGAAQADPKNDNKGLSQRVEALENSNSALESANAELKDRLEALESFVLKLHRESAAVIEFDRQGSSSSEFDGLTLTLNYCTQEEYQLNGSSCLDNLSDLSIQLANGDSGNYTFTAANDPDFDAIVDVITDGGPGWVEIGISLSTGGGSGLSSPEKVYFKDFLPADGIDLTGYTIDSITIVVDVNLISGTNPTEYILRGRVFYEFPEEG